MACGMAAIGIALFTHPAAAQTVPTITSVSAISPEQTQVITITGSGFGTMAPFDSDSPDIKIADVTGGWNAGFTGDPGGDTVTLNVSSWTDTQIVIQGFTGQYGQNGFVLNNNDQIQVFVANAQSGAVSATCSGIVGGGPSNCISSSSSPSAGVLVNGICEVGNCSPTPLAVGAASFLPYIFTVTQSNGDTYQFSGLINPSATANEGTLTDEFTGGNFTILYVGNSSGGPSQGAIFDLHAVYSFANPAQETINFTGILNGSFTPKIATSTSVTGVFALDGTPTNTFGPFVPPNAFTQSDSFNVASPGTDTYDDGSTIIFGAGSPVGSSVTTGTTLPPNSLAAAILPGSRSVQLANPATVFATVLNSSTVTLNNCQIVLPPSAPSGLTLSYQTTDPNTNAPTGTPNTPVSINAGQAQTFLLDFQTSAAATISALPLLFDCSGTNPAPSTIGVNTIDLVFSDTPIADIIALAATTSNDGTVHLANGVGAFAVASIDAGAAASLTASVDTGSATLPVAISLCQTTATGQCIGTPSASFPVNFTAGGTPTFSAFVSTDGQIPFNPGASRIFVRFTDGDGVPHGSTSVAVTTN
jgi:hypothetical protein